jgi:hypothetical protein
MAERRLLRGASLAAGAVLLAGLAFLVAGCGGGGSSAKAAATTTATTSTGTNAAARNTALKAFTTCLTQHGIDASQGGGFFFGRRPDRTRTTTAPAPPRTGTNRGGFQRPKLTAAQQKAFTACRSKLPNGGAFGGGGGFRGGNGGGNGGAGGGGQQSPAFAKYTQCLKAHGVTFGKTSSQSAFQKAQTACAKYRPSFGGGGGTPPPTTTTS